MGALNVNYSGLYIWRYTVISFNPIGSWTPNLVGTRYADCVGRHEYSLQSVGTVIRFKVVKLGKSEIKEWMYNKIIILKYWHTCGPYYEELAKTYYFLCDDSGCLILHREGSLPPPRCLRARFASFTIPLGWLLGLRSPCPWCPLHHVVAVLEMSSIRL